MHAARVASLASLLAGCSCGKSEAGSGVTCGEGTTRIGDECVPDNSGGLTCGEGTHEADGACVPDDLTCVAGTVFDATQGACVPRCTGEQYYDPEVDDCLTIPGCGEGAVMDLESEECVGWPWMELSLDTICARRAFRTCDAVFSAECACEGAGDFYTDRARGVTVGDFRGFDRDYAACLADEFWFCEVSGVAHLRFLVERGEATPDDVALAEIDSRYELAPGTCTRPAGFESLPRDLLALVDGIVPEGEACATIVSCGEDGFCGVDGDGASICMARFASGADCYTICDLFGCGTTCESGTVCAYDEGSGRDTCQAPGIEDAACTPFGSEPPCAEGLRCAATPDDPSNVCRGPQGAGERCYAPDNVGIDFRGDLCGPDLDCDELAEGTGVDGIGRCVAAVADGGACDFCATGSFPDPHWAQPDTVCEDDARCVLDGDAGECTADVSICPRTYESVYGEGGPCEPT